MKKILLLAFFFALLSSNCVSSDDDNYVQNKTLNAKGSWNLVATSGGIMGQDVQYEAKTIIWHFNIQNATVTIANNNTTIEAKKLYDGLPTGEYHFNIVEDKNHYFLFIEGDEFGQYTITENTLSINQNNTSTGARTDGYTLNFRR